MESSIATFLMRWSACELLPTDARGHTVTEVDACHLPLQRVLSSNDVMRIAHGASPSVASTTRCPEARVLIPSRPFGYDQV